MKRDRERRIVLMRDGESELDAAYRHLTILQMREVERLLKQGMGISGIACKAALTRSFVHSYVRHLNSGRA